MEYDQLFQDVGKQYMKGASYKAASAFADFAGQQIDYRNLMIDSFQTQTQADSIELQAEQEANALRQRFLQSVGTYQFGAAQRNIDVRSGSVQQNIQRSAENMGQDIQQNRKNAQMKANALRTSAKIQQKTAKAMSFNSYAGLANDLIDAADTGYTGYKLYSGK